MAVQDDGRENEMRILFGLDETPDRKRSDVDAIKVIGNEVLNFELKSSTTNSFSTVRDLGPDHIFKWQSMHWIFAFYTPDATAISEAFYASPKQMQTWVNKISAYIRPDQVLAEMLSKKVDGAVLELIFGNQSTFTVEDAQKIMKRQWTKKEYIARQDKSNGFSEQAMINILAERVQYLISRGATLNNPHITSSEVRKFSPLAVKKPESISSLLKLL
jgi:hypothetical protein